MKLVALLLLATSSLAFSQNAWYIISTRRTADGTANQTRFLPPSSTDFTSVATNPATLEPVSWTWNPNEFTIDISSGGTHGTTTPGTLTLGTVGWSKIGSKPTTLSGYGISDGVTSAALASTLSGYVMTVDLATLLSGYPTNASLASTLSGYATTGALSTGLGAKFDNPTGTTAQYVRGNGTLATFPTAVSTFTNDANYITSAGLTSALGSYASTSALTSGLSGKFNNPSGTTAQYLRGDGSLATFPTIPSNTNQLTNGAAFVDQAGARGAISLTTTGSGAATYNGATGVLNVPTPSLSLPNTGTAGTYGQVTTDAQGRVTAGKRTEAYSGVTAATTGLYTVTFSTPFSVAPNIQANIINAADNQNLRITSITATGFTVLTRNRVDVIGLLPTWNNASGLAVDVLITEK